MTAYYNENDPKAAAWLRELIKAGMVAAGDVDERSIEDVLPNDLKRYDQCHFFAGIGGWSHALRLAGWPDGQRVWTGSCPCQPFSAAGKGAGFDDKRHLWPAWFHLVRQCRPDVIFGEQVASNLAWLDLVQDDLEGEGYATGAAIIGAHSVGAPHIRQRLYWLAHTDRSIAGQPRGRGSAQGQGLPPRAESHGCSVPRELAESDGGQRGGRPITSPWDDAPGPDSGRAQGDGGAAADSQACELANAGGERRQQVTGGAPGDEGAYGRWPRPDHLAAGHGEDGGIRSVVASTDGSGLAHAQCDAGEPGWTTVEPGEGDGAARAGAPAEPGRRGDACDSRLAHADGGNACTGWEQRGGEHGQQQEDGGPGELGLAAGIGRPRLGDQPTHGGVGQAGPWAGAEWIPCRDGKWRPVEPGTFPLAHGIPGRVGLLRGYGNAIVPQDAQAFIEAYLTA